MVILVHLNFKMKTSVKIPVKIVICDGLSRLNWRFKVQRVPNYSLYSYELFVWLYLKGLHYEFGQMVSKSVFCFLQLFQRTGVRYKIMRKRSNPFNKLEDEFKQRIEKDLKSSSDRILRISDNFENKPINFSKNKESNVLLDMSQDRTMKKYFFCNFRSPQVSCDMW